MNEAETEQCKLDERTEPMKKHPAMNETKMSLIYRCKHKGATQHAQKEKKKKDINKHHTVHNQNGNLLHVVLGCEFETLAYEKHSIFIFGTEVFVRVDRRSTV